MIVQRAIGLSLVAGLDGRAPITSRSGIQPAPRPKIAHDPRFPSPELTLEKRHFLYLAVRYLDREKFGVKLHD